MGTDASDLEIAHWQKLHESAPEAGCPLCKLAERLLRRPKHYVFPGISGHEQIANARYYAKMLGEEHEIHYHLADESCPGFLVGPRFTRRCFIIGENHEFPLPSAEGR